MNLIPEINTTSFLHSIDTSVCILVKPTTTSQSLPTPTERSTVSEELLLKVAYNRPLYRPYNAINCGSYISDDSRTFQENQTQTIMVRLYHTRQNYVTA